MRQSAAVRTDTSLPINYVYVTNTGTEEFVDRYDGIDYAFPPNEAVCVPFEAARHIFGYGTTVDPVTKKKTATLVRLGWEKTPEMLDNFTFAQAQVTPVVGGVQGPKTLTLGSRQ